MRNKRKPRAAAKIMVLALLAGLLLPAAAAGEGREVVATGRAPGDSPAAREEALREALRNAVEQGVGVLIGSESAVRNFALVRDRILSRSMGYVRGYRILEEGPREGFYSVTVRAEVAESKLKWDLFALRLLRELKESPRLMVLVAEETDGVAGEGWAAGSGLEAALLEKEFELVDRARLEKIKVREVAASFDDYDRAAAIARSEGAEVLLIGRGSAGYAGREVLYGEPFEFYQATVRVKAVEAATARLIASVSAGEKWGSGDRETAAAGALERAGRKAAAGLIEEIVSAWRRDVYEAAAYELVVSGIDTGRLRSLQAGLEEMPGVRSVVRRSYRNRVAFLDVEYAGPSFSLEERLLAGSDPALELLSMEGNRLDLRVRD